MLPFQNDCRFAIVGPTQYLNEPEPRQCIHAMMSCRPEVRDYLRDLDDDWKAGLRVFDVHSGEDVSAVFLER